MRPLKRAVAIGASRPPATFLWASVVPGKTVGHATG